METGFSSPPKLRRSVCLSGNFGMMETQVITPPVISGHASVVDPSLPTPPVRSGMNELSQSSVSLEGALVEQAVDNLLSLPEVVSQVSAIQKDHNQELEKQLMQLRHLEKDIKEKEHLSENMDEFISVSTGQRESDIREEIDKVKLEICTWKEEMLRKQKTLEELKHQGEKIQIATTVLHKRNAAQLTRLKRQVREQQLRQRQWHNQSSQLQHTIAELKKKLEA